MQLFATDPLYDLFSFFSLLFLIKHDHFYIIACPNYHEKVVLLYFLNIRSIHGFELNDDDWIFNA